MAKKPKKTQKETKNNLLKIAAREELIKDTCKYTLFDDVFMNAVFLDKDACQYVVRTITGMQNVRIIDSRPQHNIKCIATRSAILDVLAQDADGTLYNIEFQRADSENHARRVRFYGALVDSSFVPKNAKFADVPNLICIYLSKTDIWKQGRSVYRVKKTFEGTDIPYNDGLEIIYANAAIDDGTAISRLMQYFQNADPTNGNHAALSARVRYLKTTEGGNEDMCEITQKYCDTVMFAEKVDQLAAMLRDGLDAERAYDYARIPYERRAEALAMAQEILAEEQE